MTVKREECPLCGADKEPTFHYDAQICDGCGWSVACDPNEPIHRFTPQERDAVLAGLSILENALKNGPLDAEINEIYTNGDQHEGLGMMHIDELCEKLNR